MALGFHNNSDFYSQSQIILPKELGARVDKK